MNIIIRIVAATKAEAKAQVAATLDSAVAQQPARALDRDQAHAAACAYIDMLRDDPTRDIAVIVNSTLLGLGDGAPVSASITIGAGLVVRAE